MLTLLITSNSITVLATQANSGSSNTHAGKGSWGSTYKRTGWLVYLVEKSNGKVPEVEMTINGKKKKVHAVNYVGYSLDSANKDLSKLKYVYTRVGKHKPAKAFKSSGSNGAEWGAPFDNGQHGRGDIIKNFFTTYKASEKKWVAEKGDIVSKSNKYQGRVDELTGNKSDAWNNDLATVDKYLGKDAREKYKTGKYYLCLEAVAIHKNTRKTRWVAFSAYGSAQLMREDGNVQIYTPKFSSNNALQIGTFLDKNWPNLPAKVPSSWRGKLIRREYIEKNNVKAKTTSSTKTMGYGFGMAAFRIPTPPEQRTYDEKSSLPSAAPKETTGDMTIVKVYVEEYETNIPQLDLSNISLSETQNTDTIEEDTAEVSPSEQDNTEPDRDAMTAEQTEALDEAYDAAIGNTGETVYDPDDEAEYNEILVDEEKEGMEDDVSEEDSKFSGEINESEAGNAQDYDYDDYNESGEEDDELMDVNESENEDLFNLLENIDFEYGTVRAYKQVEQVSAGEGGCASSAINPGVGVTKKVGNEIWIMNEDGESKNVDGT